MTTYASAEQFIGSLLATVGPTIQYWENVKSVDVQRAVNTIVIVTEAEETEYIGFGMQSFKDVKILAELYMYEQMPLTEVSNILLETFLSTAHTVTNQYRNSSQADNIAGEPIVWAKVIGERMNDSVKGIILYEITFEVRSLLTSTAQAAGSALNQQLGIVLENGTVPVETSAPGLVTAQTLTSGLMNLMLSFLGGVNGFTAVAANTVKSLDIQRTGPIMVLHMPAADGHVTGIGEGWAHGEYSQQQISMYVFKITMYAPTPGQVISASDYIAQNSVTYFLNAPFGGGITVLAKMERWGQVTNERGTWLREVELAVEAIVGP